MQHQTRARSRSHHSHSGSISVGSSSTASSRSSASSADRRRRAKTAALKRKNLPRIRDGAQKGRGGKPPSGKAERGVRPGGTSATSSALDPLPYTGPRRLSYIPESSAEWDDPSVGDSSHDDDDDPSMDTDDMEARLEELEAEARRSSDVGLGDDIDDIDDGDDKFDGRKKHGANVRSDLEVPLEDSLDDFLRRKSSSSRLTWNAKTKTNANAGADVSGVWSSVANAFESVSGRGSPRRGSSRRESAETKEDSLPSLDLTVTTGNNSGRSLEYSWSSSRNKGMFDAGGSSDNSNNNNNRSGNNHRPTPRRSGSGSGNSSTDSWGAPVADDGNARINEEHPDRPHARLHHMSTGDLSYDTWDSSKMSYGTDIDNDDVEGDDNGRANGGGGNVDTSGDNANADGGGDHDEPYYDHRSSISTNESAYRSAAAIEAATSSAGEATLEDAAAADDYAVDGSQRHVPDGADAAAGLGSSDHGGQLGDSYLIGLNDVIDSSGGAADTDGKNEEEDERADGRPRLNPHDRLHQMSTDALSCDTSGWDSKDFDNIDEMGLGDKDDEENQLHAGRHEKQDEQQRPHNRLHRMSIDDMSLESGSQASRSYDSRAAADVTGDGDRVSSFGAEDEQSAAAQSTSAASLASMSRTAQSIVNDVVNSIKGTGSGAAALASNASETEHEENPDIGIYEEEYIEDEEADGAAGMGYGESYDLDANLKTQKKRAMEPYQAQRSSRPDNHGANRLHRVSMDTIDADDLSSATPMSAQESAQQSAIQLDPRGSVSYYEPDAAMSPETRGSSQSLFKSLGQSLRGIVRRSSSQKESRDKVLPTTDQGPEEYDGYGNNDDYDGYGYDDGYPDEQRSYNEMHSAKSSRSKREACFAYVYHHMWYFLLGTCLLLGTIILIVFLVKRDDGGSDSMVGTASGKDANISRTPAELRRKDSIQSKLVDVGISDVSVLSDASSPQRLALDWLSFDDGAQLDPNDQYLFSRYGLAVLYMSAKLAENEEHHQKDLFEAPGAGGHVEGDTEWINSSNWMSSAGFCSWSGIECVPRSNSPGETKFDGDGEITHLVLPSNNIHASLPSELFSSLGRSLRVLDLSDNSFMSSIPNDINQLAKLETLDLSKNALTGRMPDVSSLKALQTLRLESNDLSGEISTLEELEALMILDLQSNDFTGKFDLTKFNRAINLKEIRVNDNDGLTGVLPYQLGFFGFMSRVEILDLSGNSFDGTVPRAIKNMKGLVELNISGNMFSGELPDTLGELLKMEVLDISDNQFEGISMPSSVCELKDNRNLMELVADCRDDFGGGMNAKVFCTCCTECA